MIGGGSEKASRCRRGAERLHPREYYKVVKNLANPSYNTVGKIVTDTRSYDIAAVVLAWNLCFSSNFYSQSSVSEQMDNKGVFTL